MFYVFYAFLFLVFTLFPPFLPFSIGKSNEGSMEAGKSLNLSSIPTLLL